MWKTFLIASTETETEAQERARAPACTPMHRHQCSRALNEVRLQLEHMCTAPVLMRLLVSGTATTTITSPRHTHTQSCVYALNTYFKALLAWKHSKRQSAPWERLCGHQCDTSVLRWWSDTQQRARQTPLSPCAITSCTLSTVTAALLLLLPRWASIRSVQQRALKQCAGSGAWTQRENSKSFQVASPVRFIISSALAPLQRVSFVTTRSPRARQFWKMRRDQRVLHSVTHARLSSCSFLFRFEQITQVKGRVALG